MENTTIQKKQSRWGKKIIIVLIVIAAAWVLGQITVPSVLKAIFL